MTFGDLPLWYVRVFATVFGLLWGSFLNVVIYRLPRDLSVVHPPSHCPGCKKPVAAYDNIPVFSYLILRGRARCCGAKMSPRYVVVELIGGVLSLAIVESILRQFPASTPIGPVVATFGAYFAIVMALVAASFIDLEHMYIPSSITYGGALLGLATAMIRGLHWKDSLIGAAVGFLVVWLPFNVLYKLIRGKTGMGMGDANLLLLVGAWTGWMGVVFALAVGSILGTLAYLGLMAFGIKLGIPQAVQEELDELRKAAAEGDKEAQEILAEEILAEDDKAGTTSQRLPFGPFLILAFFGWIFGAGAWMRSYLGVLFQ